MFSMFNNALANIPVIQSIIFADDAVFYVEDETLEGTVLKLAFSVTKLSSVLINNKLSAHQTQTKLMFTRLDH